MPAPEWVVENWPGSATVIAVRGKGSRNGKPTDETRYYVTSLRTSVIAGGFRVAIRADRRSPKGFCLQSIEYFVANYNKGSAPFSWTVTAESISEKLKRLCSRICGT